MSIYDPTIKELYDHLNRVERKIDLLTEEVNKLHSSDYWEKVIGGYGLYKVLKLIEEAQEANLHAVQELRKEVRSIVP